MVFGAAWVPKRETNVLDIADDLKHACAAIAQGRRADYPHHVEKLNTLASHASPDQRLEIADVVREMTSPTFDPWARPPGLAS